MNRRMGPETETHKAVRELIEAKDEFGDAVGDALIRPLVILLTRFLKWLSSRGVG